MNPRIPMSFEQLSRQAFRRQRFPLDGVALSLMGGLAIISILLVLLGDHATAKVQDFSWQERTVGANNTAFVMTFSRPMDLQSVEANLQITPFVPGRVSWAGRRMAYTLDVPVPYGEAYEVRIPEARDRFSEDDDPKRFEAFIGNFRSRDRALAYIGTQGDETGRLVLVNFSQGGEPVIITPPNLQVLDFEPYPLGDRILFSAIERSAAAAGKLTPALYTVATGLIPAPPPEPTTETTAISAKPDEVGTIKIILESDEYQNLAFDLAPNGKLIVVQRVHQTNPSDFGPWLVAEDAAPRPLETEPGGEFLIGPDSQTLLLLQGQGTAIIPLDANSENAEAVVEPLDFLPEFGRVFDISSDGRAAAMVNFNQNDPDRRFTETLVVVTNQGEETEVLDATGSVIDAEFDPTNRILYVLASELLPSEDYQEQPYLTAIALEQSGKSQAPLKLLTMPPQARVSMDVSPDGLAAIVEISSSADDELTTETTQMILLPLFETTEQRLNGTPAQSMPQILPFVGESPTWLP